MGWFTMVGSMLTIAGGNFRLSSISGQSGGWVCGRLPVGDRALAIAWEPCGDGSALCE